MDSSASSMPWWRCTKLPALLATADHFYRSSLPRALASLSKNGQEKPQGDGAS